MAEGGRGRERRGRSWENRTIVPKEMAERVLQKQTAVERQEGRREEDWYDIRVDYSDSVKLSDDHWKNCGGPV